MKFTLDRNERKQARRQRRSDRRKAKRFDYRDYDGCYQGDPLTVEA